MLLDLEEITRLIKQNGLKKTSMETRINYDQIWRIASGRDANPQYKTLKKLSDYLQGLRYD